MTKNEELEYYKKMLGIGDYDPAKVAFIIYLKLLTQQTSFLSDFTIKAHIDTADKDSPQYKRAMEMFDRIPSAIKSVSELRSMLKLTKGDIEELEKNDAEYKKITTPESIADET